jgi:hypothetical protein
MHRSEFRTGENNISIQVPSKFPKELRTYPQIHGGVKHSSPCRREEQPHCGQMPLVGLETHWTADLEIGGTNSGRL